MPSYSRNLPAGSVAHIVNRGNDKRLLFERAPDFEEFLGLVAWAKSVCPVRIVAYCIMSNHWHFVFWVEVEWDVSAFLHRLTGTHAKRWRKKTDTEGEGHVYQDRFRSFQIFTERYYYNALRYVEQNPMRAHLVRNPAEWRWSSLCERNGNKRSILDPDPVGIPIGWNEWVNDPLPEDDVKEIRSLLRRY